MQVNDDDWQLRTELAGNGNLYLLQVRGDSMIDAAILDGDWVAMRRQPNAENGVIIVAMINDEATVKTLRRVADRAWLMLQNPVYDPIPAQKAEILGKVATVLRRLCPCRSPWSCLAGARPYAGRRRWPAILMGSTRMKCSGSPSTQDSRPTLLIDARSASVST